MTLKNSPLNNTSINLEKEIIRRFRGLVPLLSSQCLIYRELNGRETVLCLDFTACPQELKMNQQEWSETTILLALSCDELGLANSVVWKNGEQIVGWMSLEDIASL